jgi:polysaccharide deacetylase 2 family uncharacterized protein YibQ
VKNEERQKRIILWLIVVIIVQGLFIIATFKPRAPVLSKKALKGKIAIVLDDWGYNLNNLSLVEQIKYPLTLAVLPRLSYSQEVAQKLRLRGFEIILHLPMEPREKYSLERNTLMTSFRPEVIREIIENDLASVSYIQGVSNHMGSLATEDERTMEIVLRELKKRHLFFLDSFVSARSVVPALASKLSVGFARRDIFLDNQDSPGYIRGQLEKLKLRAKAKGYAVGIGHDRRSTLLVLKEALPELESEGYRFVFLSELVK